MKGRRLFVVLSIVLLASAVASAQSVQGAWKRAEVVVKGGPEPGTNSSPQPGLMIFTKGYYSEMFVPSDEARKDHAGTGFDYTPTDAEKVRSYDSFVANSGTYEISGSKLTTHTIVAKNPNRMSEHLSTTYEFELEGDTLWLTSTRTAGGQQIETRTKLTRLE